MACNELMGIEKECTNNLGGVREIYLISVYQIENIVYTAGIITEINLTEGDFARYEPPNLSANYDVTYSIDSLGVIEYEHRINFSISKRLNSKNVELQNLAGGNREMVAIILDSNEQWWLLGAYSGLTLDTLSGGSGTSLSDGSQYNLTLSGISPVMEASISPASIPSIIPEK